MRINTALILCAGFGKRLNPITLNTPKPLLEIKDVSMLERCINLIEKLGIQKILINTFYLKDQFSVFLNSKNFNIDIKIIEDGEHILDTGGGIQNMIKDSNEKNFIIFNKGFGVFKVIGFNLLPRPAHSIKAVFIFITLSYKFWKIIF